MSCNGCRVLRKGCSENCVLRTCLQWIDSPEAQGHATIFVAKFFGRAGLLSFISAVPDSQRPALFRSLLYEACGRTVNPVNGAVGLLWTGNWHVCQAAVETVLKGGTLQPIPTLLNGGTPLSDETSDAADVACMDIPSHHHFRFSSSRSKVTQKRRRSNDQISSTNNRSEGGGDLDLGLTPNFYLRRPDTPSMNSEGSVTTNVTCLDSGLGERTILNLFV